MPAILMVYKTSIQTKTRATVLSKVQQLLLFYNFVT